MSEDSILKQRSRLSPMKRALLEKRLRGKSAKSSESPLVPQCPRPDYAPLSFAQQRLWYLDQLEPGNLAYNIPIAVRLKGSLSGAILAQCLNKIVRRHQVLRTTFVAFDGEPVQIVAPTLTLMLPIIDLQELPVAKREAQVLQLAAEEARRPFDLAQGPLLRVTLLRLSKEEYVLLLTVHHIIFDAWSAGILLQELVTLYQAFRDSKPLPLSEPPLQFADFACWQREWMQGEELESQLSYWKRQLDGLAPMSNLPLARSRPAFQTFQGATQPLALSNTLTGELETLSKQEGVTLFMTLLAAFKTLLHRYTGEDDIAVGSFIAGRNRPELEELVGFFVNTLVLRTDLSGDPAFRELLQRVREVTLEAYTYADLPFDKLVEELRSEFDLSRNPLFQVLFTFQDTPRLSLEFPDLTLEPVEILVQTAMFDLKLELWKASDSIAGRFEYNTDLFETATITRMADRFKILLEDIVANPDNSISALSIVRTAERDWLLNEFNDLED